MLGLRIPTGDAAAGLSVLAAPVARGRMEVVVYPSPTLDRGELVLGSRGAPFALTLAGRVPVATLPATHGVGWFGLRKGKQTR